MASRDLVVVGWYHSHPYSEPRPSQNDVLSHKKYQDSLTTESGEEPCIGLIISETIIATTTYTYSQMILRHFFHHFSKGPNLGGKTGDMEPKIATFWVLTVQQDGVKVRLAE